MLKTLADKALALSLKIEVEQMKWKILSETVEGDRRRLLEAFRCS